MPRSKIIYGDEVLIDLTGDTVTAETLAEGATAHDKAGNAITGTMVAAKPEQAKTATPSTSQQVIKPDSGYALSQVTVNAMPTATQATPSISVSSGGLITASAQQAAGYVSAGTKSATKQLTTQAAKTVTPSLSQQTAVASGAYTTGAVTVAPITSALLTSLDADFKAENIAEGVNMFGLVGAMVAGGGKSAYGTLTVSTTDVKTHTISGLDFEPTKVFMACSSWSSVGSDDSACNYLFHVQGVASIQWDYWEKWTTATINYDSSTGTLTVDRTLCRRLARGTWWYFIAE